MGDRGANRSPWESTTHVKGLVARSSQDLQNLRFSVTRSILSVPGLRGSCAVVQGQGVRDVSALDREEEQLPPDVGKLTEHELADNELADAEFADDEFTGRRSARAFPLPASRWDGSWWRCPAVVDGSQCTYAERGLWTAPYGDGVCPDHDLELTYSQNAPDQEASR